MVRKARIEDAERIYTIYQQAVKYFKESGIDQWQDGYPNMDTIISDIEKNQAYVVEENQVVLGVTMFMLDPEETYEHIEGGEWLTKPSDIYGTIHRIAVDENVKGKKLAKQLLDYCEVLALKEEAKSIRVDTHLDNHSMQNFLKRAGFTYCGDVKMLDGAPRVAFEKLI